MRERLCMIVHGPFPVGEPRVAQEARVAQALGWDVDVICLRRTGEPARETIGGIEIRRVALHHRRGASFVRTVSEYLVFAIVAAGIAAWRSITRRYAVVQVHAPPDFLVTAALVPRLLGARVVLDVHDRSVDMFAMRFGRSGAARVVRPLLAALERLACRAADAVVTVHEPYAEELVRASGIARARTFVVMNVVDPSLLAQIEVTSAARPTVVYHGTVTPPYGVGLLVEAFATLVLAVPDAVLELYGEGDALDDVLAAAARLGIERQVVATGRYVDRRAVLERVACASVGVVPNLPTELNRFALPSKLFEYVALGVPVVCADLPTIRRHFPGDELHWFRAGDAADLARALREATSDPAAAVERAERARDRARAYAWQRSADRYASLLRGLAAR